MQAQKPVWGVPSAFDMDMHSKGLARYGTRERNVDEYKW
jgi:hypothetical protein